MWQARYVADLLTSQRADLEVEFVSASTFGDLRQDLSIQDIGGKGAFCKEIQLLVLQGHADVAVHSAKDLQAVTPEDLAIAAFCPRGDARDVLVGARLADLAPQAVVATGSNRRIALLRDLRPDLRFVGLRGNIATRLAKVGTPSDDGPIDAVVMAAAALHRLDLAPATVDHLPVEPFTPQVGQAAIAVEVRRGDDAVRELVSGVDHVNTRLAVSAERSFLMELGGDCRLPAGAHAEVAAAAGEAGGPTVRIQGVLADPQGRRMQRAVEVGPVADDPGRVLARTLRKMLEAAPSIVD
jgi:hydroxymethylbilane synthase